MSSLNEKLAVLESVAAKPAQQLEAFVAQGKKVIGCLPVYCPEEIVQAAGMVPFAIWGAEMEISSAKQYFPPFFCSIAQTSLEMGLSGRLDKLSAVLIPVLCDTLKCLGQNWKAGVKNIPFIPVIHPQNRKIEAGVVFLSKQYQKIAAELGKISGQEVTEAALQKAIEDFNKHRAVMREFSEIAAQYPDLISPLQRNAVIKSGGFMDKNEHAKLVSEIIAECKKQPVKPWSGHKVLVTGIIADSPALLKILADNKFAIVADEVAQESRQFRTDVPHDADPYRALALQIANMEGCSVLYDPEKKRASLIVDLAKKHGAKGVIYVQTKFCDPEEFDYPVIKKAADKAGLPLVNIEVDQQMRSYEQARTALQTFADVLA